MSDPRPDGPEGWGALTRVTEDADLTDSLRRIAGTGCSLLDSCSAASVTVIVARRPVTMAATDELATALDQAQYDMDDGPCLTAARRQETIRIDSIADDDRWPTFRDAAIGHDIGSSLSLPLIISDDGTFGGLNLYAHGVARLSADDQQLAATFALQASIAVSNVVAYWASFDLSRNLQAAM